MAKSRMGWRGEKVRHSRAKKYGKAGGTYKGIGVGQAGKTRYGAIVQVKDKGNHTYLADVKIKKRMDAKKELSPGTYKGMAVVKKGNKKYNATIKVNKKNELHYQALIEVKKGKN